VKETRLKRSQMVSEKSFVLFEVRKPVRKSVRERNKSDEKLKPLELCMSFNGERRSFHGGNFRN
jgi:hypothetical protein